MPNAILAIDLYFWQTTSDSMFRRDLNIQASRDLIRASSAPSLQAAASSHFRQGEKKVKQIDIMAFFG